MILPLFAGLDRLSQTMLEAVARPRRRRLSSFRRVTLPLCRPRSSPPCCSRACRCSATTSPTTCSRPRQDLDGRQPDQQQRPDAGQTGQAGAFVMLVFLVALLPMLYYIRASSRARRGSGSDGHPGDRSAGGATRGGRPGSWSASPSRYLAWSLLPVLIAVAVLVQRRQVAHDVAGFLVPLVLRRQTLLGLAQRRLHTALLQTSSWVSSPR